MKVLWCWRCKTDMPMLDEEEYALIHRLYGECMHATADFRKAQGLSLYDMSSDVRFRPLRLKYEKITGMKDCYHNAIMHHRLSIYGPPCGRCGKPLRTPTAKLCGSCMAPVQTNSNVV